MYEEIQYLAALQSIPGIGSAHVRQLVEHFGTAATAWETLKTDNAFPLSNKTEDSTLLHRYIKSFNWYSFLENLRKQRVSLLSLWEKDYPHLLQKTYNPPAVLFYKGMLPHDDKCVAIVGSRKCSAYGKNAALQLSCDLADHKISIISGGARGIDTAAHTGALKTQGYTAAVLACGLDRIYPPENKNIFSNILEQGGVLLTEYPLGMEPLAQNFPARNRIISGLARCVIVVEAAKRSGSLITADFALEEGRDVYAVPGNIFTATSKGTNHLLRSGAIPITSADDLLADYGWDSTETKKEVQQLSLLENSILTRIPYDRIIHQDDLLLQSKLSIAELNSIIVSLLIKGCIREEGSGQYVRCP